MNVGRLSAEGFFIYLELRLNTVHMHFFTWQKNACGRAANSVKNKKGTNAR